MTLINHRYRFIFIHIPKNAGTSVARYLSQLSSYRDQEIGATDLGEAVAPHYRDRFGLQKHSTLAEIRAAMGPDDPPPYRTIAVVRDPVDRVRSILTFLLRWTDWASLDAMYAPFESEMQRYDSIDAFVDSDLFLMPGPDRMFMPQVTWLTSEDDGSVVVDQLLRFEHLGDDLEPAIDELRLPRGLLRRPMGRANVSLELGNPPQGGLKAGIRARLPGAHPARYRPLPVVSPAPPSSRTVDRIHERYARDYELLAATQS